jgi:hypothetical protein
MAALRRRKIFAALLKLTRRARRRSSSSLITGPGCTCESCVQAWDRHHPAGNIAVAGGAGRRLRPRLD